MSFARASDGATYSYKGVFKYIKGLSGYTFNTTANWPFALDSAGFSFEGVVPIAAENSPRTAITRHWRLVARGL